MVSFEIIFVFVMKTIIHQGALNALQAESIHEVVEIRFQIESILDFDFKNERFQIDVEFFLSAAFDSNESIP